VHDADAMSQSEHFLHLGTDQQDSRSGAREIGQEPVDLGFGADVDAAIGLVQDDQPGLSAEPFGQHDLLLVAAAQ